MQIKLTTDTNNQITNKFSLLDGDYMIPVGWDDILSHFTGIPAVI